MGPVPLVVKSAAPSGTLSGRPTRPGKLKICSYASISRERKVVTAAMRDGFNEAQLVLSGAMAKTKNAPAAKAAGRAWNCRCARNFVLCFRT